MEKTTNLHSTLNVPTPVQPLMVTFQHENESQAWRNFYDLRKRFLHLNRWKAMDKKGISLEFKVLNSLKQPVNRPVQVGDWVSVYSSAKNSAPVFLNVKDIHNNHDCNGDEECVKLIFDENSSMEIYSSVVSGIKELVLKRKQSLIQVSLIKRTGTDNTFDISKNINWLPVMTQLLNGLTVN